MASSGTRSFHPATNTVQIFTAKIWKILKKVMLLSGCI